MEQELSGTIGIIVVAAGRGERAGASAEGPKQYRGSAESRSSAHAEALSRLAKSGPVVVVIHPDDRALFDAAVSELPARHSVLVETGGATRQESVLNGLRPCARATSNP